MSRLVSRPREVSLRYYRGTYASEVGLHLEISRECFSVSLIVLEEREGEREREIDRSMGGGKVGGWLDG
jgi:hypothetical protein